MKIIDLHCDTLLECYLNKTRNPRDGAGHLNLLKMKKNQALAQCFAIFTPTHEDAKEQEIEVGTYELYKEMRNIFKNMVNNNNDIVNFAGRPEDIKKNMEENKISAILTIEDGAFAEGRIERIQEVYEDGVRMLTLVWNYENEMAFPNSNDPEKHLKGLKPFGFEVIAKMNELGMIIDVSHLNEGGFYDVANNSAKPFVASHSCARTLCDHKRNLDDKQLKTIGEKGGLVGVNFNSYFLEAESSLAKNETIIRHIVYMVNKAGIESVGLGSDFDGISCELEMKGYEGYPDLLSRLENHFTLDEIDKICFENSLRVFAEQN